MYESTITFTMDTICPWTYIGKKRLDQALSNFALSDLASKARFTVRFQPFQLHPDMAAEGQDRRAWLAGAEHGGDAARLEAFERAIRPHGEAVGIDFFDLLGDDDDNGAAAAAAVVANSFDAHRVIQHFQGDRDEDEGEGEDAGRAAAAERYGPATASRLAGALFRAHLERGGHPASPETLLAACAEAGVAGADAREAVAGGAGAARTRARLRRSRADGIDAVPTVRVEGRKRDVTLVGAREVEEYERALRMVAEESG